MKIACIQPEVYNSREKCYAEVERLLLDLLEDDDNYDLITLPERWVPFYNDMPLNFQKERGNDYLFIKRLANEYQVKILTGAIWEKRNSKKKPVITSYYFNSYGEEIGRQDKIHLYSFERDLFEPGKELNIFNLGESKFAILICFDVAFYETPRLAAENGADLLISPTQIKEEGLENWKIYLQARALENKIPIAACNTVAKINNNKFLGKSKIISFIKGPITPSKLKLSEGPKISGYVCDNIDLKFPKKLRKIRFNEKIEKSSIIITKPTKK